MRNLAAILLCLFFLFPAASLGEEEIVSQEIHMDPAIELVEPTPAPTPTPRPVSVRIFWHGGSLPSIIHSGTPITIVCEVDGLDEAASIAYQWQEDCGDGRGFVDIPGATQSTYTFPATHEALTMKSWRVQVTYSR